LSKAGAGGLHGWQEEYWWLTGLPQRLNPFREGQKDMELCLIEQDDGRLCFCEKDTHTGEWVPQERFYPRSLDAENERFWLKRDYQMALAAYREIHGENKGEYYRALQASSYGWHENKNDYEPFIIYMIQILYECYTKLDENVFSQIDKKMSKSERIKSLLLNAFVPVSKKTIKDQLPDVSEHLIEMELSKLLKEGVIIKIGSYKDAMYYRK
jgi:hypothetical protein